MRTIDFDDEPSASADEVADVACERDLTPEGHTQLAIDERSPEQAFWWRAISAHAGSASGEKSLTLRGNGAIAHESLLSPAKRPAAAHPRAASVPAPHRTGRAMPGLARRVRALGEGRPRPGLGRRAPERRAIDDGAADERSDTRIAERVALALRLGATPSRAGDRGGRLDARDDALPPRPPAAKRGRTLGGSRRAAGPTEGGIQDERRTPAGAASEHVFFVRVGGSVIAEIKPTSGDSSDTKYLLSDHLGSPHLLTGEDGQVLDELSFTAFGKRRNAQWASDAPVGPALSTISYTGHEADDDVGLINMRGRQYDPKLGQFIQPDPIVQAPDFSQSWNRYAYVFNNPLKFVDPTGYETTGSNGEGSGSSGEESGLAPGATHGTDAKIDGKWGPTRRGEVLTKKADSEHVYWNSGGDKVYQLPATLPADLAAATGSMIAALNESAPQGEATNQTASLDTSKSATDAPGNTESGSKASSNSKGEGSGSGGGGGNSLMQDLLTGAAFINMEFPDAIRTDGTGSAGGIPGGQCDSCAGSPAAQAVYLGVAAAGPLGGIGKGLGKGLARGVGPSIDALSQVGRALDPADKAGLLTKAGRALQKHRAGGRPGASKFPGVKGPPGNWNQAGQDQLDDILTIPGSTTTPLGRGGWQVTAPDGRGARFNADGGFAGFVE